MEGGQSSGLDTSGSPPPPSSHPSDPAHLLPFTAPPASVRLLKSTLSHPSLQVELAIWGHLCP